MIAREAMALLGSTLDVHQPVNAALAFGEKQIGRSRARAVHAACTCCCSTSRPATLGQHEADRLRRPPPPVRLGRPRHRLCIAPPASTSSRFARASSSCAAVTSCIDRPAASFGIAELIGRARTRGCRRSSMFMSTARTEETVLSVEWTHGQRFLSSQRVWRSSGLFGMAAAARSITYILVQRALRRSLDAGRLARDRRRGGVLARV